MSISIGRLKIGRDTPKDPEGRMTLVEHLAELRSRLMIAVLTIVVGMVITWIFYEPIFNLLKEPFWSTINQLKQERGLDAKLVIGDVAGPLMLQLKVSLVGGLVVSSPVWLYQIWAFIMPGLHRNERKWTMVFVGTAAPLFIIGVVVGYLAMPKGLNVLIDFTPMEVSNFVQLDTYLSFTLRLLVVFGISFEIPIFVILLNLVGILSVARLKKWRAPIIFILFVFAAVATPSTDPITMLILALPMSALFLASEVIARFIERRRRANLIAEGIDIDAIENAANLDDD
ncbi:twin-arginine translocase subunit TatC [Flindersiella endophytica]